MADDLMNPRVGHPSRKPAAVDHPPHGTHPTLGKKKGGPMSHATGGNLCGGSRDYDPPGVAGIQISGGFKPIGGD